jgi:ArsR family transcriptional regulator
MSLDQAMAALQALTDRTRVRLLALLEDEELSVAELTRVLDAPQSRVSTHLARLREAGFLVDRAEGASNRYRLADGAMPQPARAALEAMHDAIAGDAEIARDRERRARVLADRAAVAWADRVAGSLERQYSPGRTWEALARSLLLLTDLGDVVDVGAGDGAIGELLATRARSVMCVDRSQRMVEAGLARVRRARLTGVRVVRGDMHELPLRSACADLVLLQQSLQYAAEPARAIKEATRLLRPGGRLLLVTLEKHTHADVREAYGHRHLGFEAGYLRRLLRSIGLESVDVVAAGRERTPPHFAAIAAFGQRPMTPRRRPS